MKEEKKVERGCRENTLSLCSSLFIIRLCVCVCGSAAADWLSCWHGEEGGRMGCCAVIGWSQAQGQMGDFSAVFLSSFSPSSQTLLILLFFCPPSFFLSPISFSSIPSSLLSPLPSSSSPSSHSFFSSFLHPSLWFPPSLFCLFSVLVLALIPPLLLLLDLCHLLFSLLFLLLPRVLSVVSSLHPSLLRLYEFISFTVKSSLFGFSLRSYKNITVVLLCL